MRPFAGLILGFAIVLSPALPAAAQDRSETLADIRQEMSVLYVEVQKLKRELSTTGASGALNTGGSALNRIDAIESELQRLTGKTEELEHRIDRVVTDGTNRIGDLEFRLVELEGGDISKLGQTSTLGGGAMPDSGGGAAPAVPSNGVPVSQGTELAIGEEADFQRASEALANGDFRGAADLLETFGTTYPGSPLEPEARVKRGEALEKLGQPTEAARSFLAAYTLAPDGPLAPGALFNVGRLLGQLGKAQDACVTLGQVSVRYPEAAAATRANAEMQSLGCS
ncbi:tol-pal system protein YbgF [Pseudooceanicola nanhaiensis]|uniref:tol-pal system protein YbgF n=1 Tax=Pseudooceanicola nanhaiensis TaxID=375761 RepID=UPI001CD48A4E|nr:tol-pal system protein YbgF [Pseudooceanicola nanhaiensis]MCA0919464.1 tol-pal system protein YbgF [Pseudooceanicola nanhaiensis]